MFIIFCWLVIAMLFCSLGLVTGSKGLLGAGAVMVISMAAVAGISY